MTEEAKSKKQLTDISLILKDLLKVIKVVSLYPEDNPLPQSLRRSFAEKLVNIIEENGEIKITVGKEQLNWNGEVVFEDGSKEDRLAGIFFETGITDFAFKESIDVLEIYRLLDIIKNYMNAPNKSLDLVALIWEAALDNFTFGTVEDVALSQYDGNLNIGSTNLPGASEISGEIVFGVESSVEYQAIFDQVIETEAGNVDLDQPVDLPRNGKNVRYVRGIPGGAPAAGSAGVQAANAGQIFEADGFDLGELRAAEAAGAMGFADLPAGESSPIPDTTLILNDELKLSDEEEETIAGLIEEDTDFDPWESTLLLLQEMLNQEDEMPDFYETVTICEKVLTEFVTSGRLTTASRLLAYFRLIDGKLRKNKPLWAERVKEVIITAGSRERLRHLSEALKNHSQIGSIELSRYLDNFGWEALSGITDLLVDTEHDVHREALCNYLARRGRDNIDLISKGIFDKRPDVACNSVTIMAQIGDDRAMEFLSKALGHDDIRVRLQLVRELKDSQSNKALEILTAAVGDKEQEIRTEAVNSIVARRGRAAFEAVTTALNEDTFASLLEDDQMALLRAFSILGGDAAVGYLSRLILKPNWFGNRSQGFYRLAAFEALSHNRSDKGEELLVKLSSSWRGDIRRQAVESLNRRRQITYGGHE